MSLPGLTTTRLHLGLAAGCLLAHSWAGVLAAALVVTVTLARVWVRRRLDHAPATVVRIDPAAAPLVAFPGGATRARAS
jgi:hypothetical protein